MNLMMNEEQELRPRITVFGVGGAGGNAVNNMIEKQLDGVEFVVANTDAQALAQSRAGSRIQMGPKVTEGLGAGAKPSIGAKAAEETIEDIVDHLIGAHMCFITAGMGGGTGTGAAPIIAQAAREMGILTVGVVTKPFQFEGSKRMRQADEGVQALQQVVDTLIIIPNQNLFRLANEKTTFTEAFAMADDVLYQGVKGVTDLMVRPGLINLDFADVRAVMDEMGKAMMGTGQAEGENRAREAAERAIANPLLDEVSLNGAKGVLINITGGYDMTLFELDEAANVIREKVDEGANIIVGSTLDPDMEGSVRVSVVATGIDVAAAQGDIPAPRRSIAEPLTTTPSIAQKDDAQPDMVDDMPVPPRRTPAPMPEVAVRDTPKEAPPVRQETVQRDSEDLPPPAYDPRSRTAGHPAGLEQSTLDFVPPKSPVSDRPSISEAVSRRMSKPAEAEGDLRASRSPQSGADNHHSRMGGLRDMIGRMTGSSEQKPPTGTIAERVNQRAATLTRQKEVDYDDLASPDQADDNIEIPAFLRRQAN